MWAGVTTWLNQTNFEKSKDKKNGEQFFPENGEAIWNLQTVSSEIKIINKIYLFNSIMSLKIVVISTDNISLKLFPWMILIQFEQIRPGASSHPHSLGLVEPLSLNNIDERDLNNIQSWQRPVVLSAMNKFILCAIFLYNVYEMMNSDLGLKMTPYTKYSL